MRALVTGGTGFVGPHLATHLTKCGDDVAVTYGRPERPTTVSLPKTAQTISLDVTNRDAVFNVIKLLQPDALYHLAGMSFAPSVEDNPRTAFEVNFYGTLNILDAVVAHSPSTRILYVGSAQVYGEPWPGTLPLTESALLRPMNLYGVSKASADLAACSYALKHRLFVIRARPFNHTGPGQKEVFALSSFAKQLALIKLGRAEPVLRVGNLEVKRDYLDVSDVVRGYREALLNGTSGEVYNFCSGKSYALSELLQSLIKIAEVDVEVVVDPSLVRAVDVPDFYGSHQKALKDFGWKPRIDLVGTLSSLFAYWVEELSKK